VWFGSVWWTFLWAWLCNGQRALWRLWMGLAPIARLLWPPMRGHDWPLVAYQPLWFTALWVGAVLLIFFGDFGARADCDHTDVVITVLPSAWFALTLIGPPQALASAWMILKTNGKLRYLGLWARFSADLEVAAALLAYLAARYAVRDFHVIPMAALTASTIFSVLLVARDIMVLRINECMAKTTHRERTEQQHNNAAR
jgi:hypothetical protein